MSKEMAPPPYPGTQPVGAYPPQPQPGYAAPQQGYPPPQQAYAPPPAQGYPPAAANANQQTTVVVAGGTTVVPRGGCTRCGVRPYCTALLHVLSLSLLLQSD